MNNLFNANWITQSLLGLMLVVPTWLAVGFFNKNFQIPPHIFIVFYFIGMLIGIPTFLLYSKMTTANTLFRFGWPQLAIIAIGILLGALANTLVFSATTKAPNPGLPIAISGSSSVFVFFLSMFLAWIFPKYFDPKTVDLFHFIGIFLTFTGLIMIVYKR